MLKRNVTSKQRRNVTCARWLWEVQIKCKSHSVRLGLVSGVWISFCTRILFDIWWYKIRFRWHEERYEKCSPWWHWDVKMLFDAKILHRQALFSISHAWEHAQTAHEITECMLSSTEKTGQRTCKGCEGLRKESAFLSPRGNCQQSF